MIFFSVFIYNFIIKDFLGFNIRCFNTKSGDKVYTQPSKDSYKKLCTKIRDIYIRCRNNIPLLIDKWNKLLFGTAMYWRQSVSKRTFSKIDHYVWKLTKRALKRLHNNAIVTTISKNAKNG